MMFKMNNAIFLSGSRCICGRNSTWGIYRLLIHHPSKVNLLLSSNFSPLLSILKRNNDFLLEKRLQHIHNAILEIGEEKKTEIQEADGRNLLFLP